MQYDSIIRFLVALFCAICVVAGSMLLSAFNREHPIVIGDGALTHLLADTGLVSRPERSGSIWD